MLRGFTAFDLFLEQHPEFRERVTFIAQLMPSRTDVPEYAEYLERIEALVAVVNHRHGTPDWMPIHLKLRDDLEEAVAAYKHYDVLLVNAMFDGMNLVAKEGPLVNERDGVSILSENTGAHEELGEFALSVNPFDIQELADSIHAALTMAPAERARRMAGLEGIVTAARSRATGSTSSSRTSARRSARTAAERCVLERELAALAATGAVPRAAAWLRAGPVAGGVPAAAPRDSRTRATRPIGVPAARASRPAPLHAVPCASLAARRARPPPRIARRSTRRAPGRLTRSPPLAARPSAPSRRSPARRRHGAAPARPGAPARAAAAPSAPDARARRRARATASDDRGEWRRWPSGRGAERRRGVAHRASEAPGRQISPPLL